MNLPDTHKTKGRVSVRLLMGILALGMLPEFLLASDPTWWAARGVKNGNSANDYAAVNQGQVKHFVAAAVAELNAQVPGGAGDSLNNLVNGWSKPTAQTNDYAAVNLGQLKSVTLPIYDRLLAVCYQGHPLESGTYPWAGKEASANDYAIANIGQVKNLFSFDLTCDSNGNGLPDWWENSYFGGTVPDPSAPAPRGDGLSILQAYQQGLNPNDYYNGQAPYFWIAGGNGQTGTPGAFAANPLTVWVADGSTWQSLSNAPVTFVVRQGGGGLATSITSGSTTLSTLQVRTDSNGYAQVYYQEPNGNSIASLVSAAAGIAPALLFVSFNGSTTVSEWKFDEGTGTAVSDSSGAGANGTLHNAVTWSTSFDNSGALQFDGQSGYVEVPNSSIFNIGSGPMTVMAWVRLTAGTPLAADTDVYNILYKGTTAGSGIQLALAGGSANGLLARVFSSGTCQQMTPWGDQSATLTDGNWHHLVFQRDENGSANLYIDGNCVGYQTAMSVSIDSMQPLWIGRGESGGYFNGMIDDVAVWRAAADWYGIANVYNHDSDGNGLPDSWEVKYFGSIGQNPNALAPRGDGLTLLQAYQWGYNPIDFYNGWVPSLSIVSGGDQRGTPGTMLALPLSVSINWGVYNAPITFTVTSGSALLSATSGTDGVPAASVMVRSINTYADAFGNQQSVAQVYIHLPNNTADLSVITATATSGTQTISISTTAASIDPALIAPSNLTATPTSPTTVDLAWTPSDSTQPTTIQASTDGGATWANVGAVSPGINSLTVTGMTPNASVSFRAVTGNITGNAASDGGSASMPTQAGGGFAGSGGGSSPGNSKTVRPVSQPVIMGEQQTFNGYKHGYSGFIDDSKRFLKSTDYVYSNETPGYHDDGGSTTTTSITDPKTGQIERAINRTEMGGLDYGSVWKIDSDTYKSRTGTDYTSRDTSGNPCEFSFREVTLDDEYTTETFHSNVASWVPAFTNQYTEGIDTASIYDSAKDSNVNNDLQYDITKLKYYFQVNSDPDGVVSWAVVFTPDDGSDPKIKLYSEPTNGSTKVPTTPLVIDPSTDNLGLNPDKKNGTYRLLPVELVDVNGGALDSGSHAIITPKTSVDDKNPNSIAWIDPHRSNDGPDMPQLVIRLKGADQMGLSVKWKLTVKYKRPNGSVLTEDTVTIPKNGDWVSEPTAGTGKAYIFCHEDWLTAVSEGLFGGDAELTYQILKDDTVLCDQQKILFNIGGKNPDDGKCKSYINQLAGYTDSRLTGLSYAVGRHESKDYNGEGSRYNQFWESAGTRFNATHKKGDPLWCKSPSEESAGGFGIFQITGDATHGKYYNVSRNVMWNWQANLSAYLGIVKNEGNASKAYWWESVFLPWVQQNEGSSYRAPQTSYTYNNRTMTSWEMAVITLYNGAGGCPKQEYNNGQSWKRCPWHFDNPGWSYHENSNNYLSEVMAEAQ